MGPLAVVLYRANYSGDYRDRLGQPGPICSAFISIVGRYYKGFKKRVRGR